jgi:hypothetical protein
VTEVVPAEPSILPYDSRDLRELIFSLWRKPRSSRPGEPGAVLFDFFSRSLTKRDLDVQGMEAACLSLLEEVRGLIAVPDVQNLYYFFVALHRFHTLIFRGQRLGEFVGHLKQFVEDSFHWLIMESLQVVLDDFVVCTRESRGHEFEAARKRIMEHKQMMRTPIGEFIQHKLLAAVDGQLANQLLDPRKYTQTEELKHGVEAVKTFAKSSGISLPIFSESITVVLEYEHMLQQNVQFDERAKHVPPKFFAALVFAAKRKGLLPLQLSDQRLINWADYMKIDLTDIDRYTLTVDESKTEIPMSLWT